MAQLTIFQHDEYPSEQFEDTEQQKETATLGMWTFLATEVLFFGVMFVGFYAYRIRWKADFAEAAHDLKWYLGAINTAVLLVSSFCMAMAVHCSKHLKHKTAESGRETATRLSSSKSSVVGDDSAEREDCERTKLVRWLTTTLVLGFVFLGIKFTEYRLEYEDHLVPRLNFATTSPDGKHRPVQEEIFMTFYFVMTGFHALHVTIGLGVITTLIVLTKKGWFSAEYHNPVEISGLYWHFVDLVWVFLFPTLYLLRHI